MTDDELRAAAHANLVTWNRVFAEHNNGRIADDAGLVMVSLPFEYPGFRITVAVGPTSAASLDAATEFFKGDPDAFVIYARPELDEELMSGRAVELFRPPQMSCAARLDDRPRTDDVTVELSNDPDDLHGYAVVAGNAFADLNFPADQTTAALDQPSLLDDPRVALAVAKLDGRVIAGAVSVTEHGGCYVSFVAADNDARRAGIGDAVTRAVTNAGFDAGATMASLEASHFGHRIYQRMGFQDIYEYALLVALPPKS